MNSSDIKRKALNMPASLSFARSQCDPSPQTKIERKKLLLPEQTQITFRLGSPSPLTKLYYESNGAFVLYVPNSGFDAEPPNTITALIPRLDGLRLTKRPAR
jgi:hypothetical protein